MRSFLPIRSLQHLRRFPRSVQGALIGVMCALFMQVLLSLGWVRPLERSSFDALFRLRGAHPGAPQIALVLADEATAAHYKTWPLPRHAHADLVRELHRAGAKTIAYDALFSAPSVPRDDRDFLRACREAGNVVHSGIFQIPAADVPSAGEALLKESSIKGEPAARFALSGRLGMNPHSRIPQALWFSGPLPELAGAAPLLGHINSRPQRDGALRSIPHVIEYRRKLYPSLALAAALHYWGLKASEVRVRDSQIRLLREGREFRRLALEPDGETAINWTGGLGNLPSYSMAKVLAREVPPDAFKDKIVFVGATVPDSLQWRSTPFSSGQPGVELQANALDNILLDRPLRITPAELRFLLMLVFATGVGALVAPRFNFAGVFWLLSGSILLWCAALYALARESTYLPVAPAILAAILAYALALALNYRDEWETNARVDASIATLARGALMLSDRNRKQIYHSIRATACEALDAEDVFLVLDGRPTEDEDNEDGKNRNEPRFVRALAQAIRERGQVAFYPTSRRDNEFALDELLSASPGSTLAESVPPRGITWIAAPILNSQARCAGQVAAENAGAPAMQKPARNALIAVARTQERRFTARDAILMQAIAEQAGLALEALEYAELLQGRVEWANRELREAYGVLSSQTAKFMAAVESMDDAFIICDASHCAVFVNAAAQPILRDATPHLSDDVPRVLREHGLPQIAALFDGMMGQGEAVRQEYPVGERVLAVQLTPLYENEASAGARDIASTRTGAMLIVSDVTAQRELEQMKTDFVGFVAHELRSPLATIMGYASLLQQTSAESDPLQADMMQAIERQCRRMNRLVNDMLDIARLDAGFSLDLRLADTSVKALCERVLESYRSAATDEKLRFSFRCDLAGETIYADTDRIEQILINLLSNAAKYSPAGGEVVLSLSETERDVRLCVSDQGIGMTPAEVEKLFQKFYRAPDAKARGIKGTGLGLFLVKQLVEAHHGKIEVQSEPGHGTAFTVILPKRAVAS